MQCPVSNFFSHKSNNVITFYIIELQLHTSKATNAKTFREKVVDFVEVQLVKLCIKYVIPSCLSTVDVVQISKGLMFEIKRLKSRYSIYNQKILCKTTNLRNEKNSKLLKNVFLSPLSLPTKSGTTHQTSFNVKLIPKTQKLNFLNNHITT